MSADGLRVERGVAPEQRLPSWTLDSRRERAVTPHPDTGAKTLLLAPVALDYVEGFEPEESRRLVEGLLAPGVAPGRVYSHSWRAGDLVCWVSAAV